MTSVLSQDVIIIGAGIAGIGAAVDLKAKGLDVQIIEARDRVGGRTWTSIVNAPTSKEAGASKTQLVLDYGAMWIHGGVSDLTNPVAKLAKKYNLPFFTEGQDEQVIYQGAQHLTHVQQQLMDDELSAFTDYLEAAENGDQLDCSTAAGRAVTVRQLLQQFAASRRAATTNYDNVYNLLLNAVNTEIAQEFAAPLGKMSACFWDSDTGTLPEGDGWMGSTGYMNIVEKMIDEHGLRPAIDLNQVVRHIDYRAATLSANGGHVVVTAAGPDGVVTKYSAPYVLVTIPLGVLKTNDVQFQPQLPKAKRDAIQRLGMGILDKVFLLFEDVFWDEDAFWLGRVVPNDQVGEWTQFVSPYKYTKQPVLVAFIAGNEAANAETQPSLRATVRRVLAALSTMYPGKVPNIDNVPFYARYFWGLDRFSRGSYSFVKANSTDIERSRLGSPVNVPGYGRRLFFAGEATHTGFPSTVHGALMAGQDAAKTISSLAT